jgi:hypothetical protein
MAIICENIITPGLKVKETLFHVYNWNDTGSNVDKIELLFDNGEHIVYETELKLDLPNGSYKYENGKYILIDDSNEIEDLKEKEAANVFIEKMKYLKDLDNLIGYYDYLIEQSSSISLEIKGKATAIKEKLNSFLIAPETLEDISEYQKKADLLVLDINKIIDNIPEKVRQGQKYLFYLEEKFTKVVEKTYSKINEENFEDFRKCADILADAFENLYEYNKKN